MTYREKYRLDHPDRPLDIEEMCPTHFGYELLFCANPANKDEARATCEACWDQEMPPRDHVTPRILDSGERQQFDTGAVRDIQEGKGRPDLMPLRVLAYIWRTIDPDYADKGVDKARIFEWIADFMDTGDTKNLIFAINSFTGYLDWPTAFLEAAKHFEEGAKKYGENNWQKGLPVNCYINSTLRHYFKWLRGDTDEPHDRAFVWNLLCCIWEVDFSPRAKMKGTLIAEELPDPEANSGRFYICNRTPCETCYSDCHCTEYRGEAAVLELCDRDVRYDECPVGLFMTDAVVTPIKYPFKERERE